MLFSKNKTPVVGDDLLSRRSNIIGPEVFHFRVRYGIGWDNLGIVAKYWGFIVLFT